MYQNMLKHIELFPDLVKTSQPVLKKELSDERNDADYKGDFGENMLDLKKNLFNNLLQFTF